MKLLILSDSHRIMSGMERAVAYEKPDYIFHLGDHDTDALELGRIFPDIPLFSVCGNCDMRPVSDPRMMVRLGGKTIFAAHGHTYGVKTGYDRIINTAMTAGADILLFGHTHAPYYEVMDGFHIINPGAVGPGMTYGVLTIENGDIRYEPKYVYDIPPDSELI